LRLKSSNYVSVGLGSVHSVSYQFLASDGSSVTVVPADTNQPETGVITVSNSSWSTPGLVTDVRELAGAGGPSAFSLDQNYPNPFNPSTNLRFELSEAVHTRLSVFNTIGQEVGVLVNGPLGAGRYEVTFDARDLESGVYFYRMIAGRFFEVKKMILIR
jgi:hypothetical protein